MKKAFLIVSICTCMMISATTALAVEFSADESVSAAITGTTKGKVYYKNTDTHRHEIMGIINITKGSTVYQLVKKTKKYTVTNVDDLTGGNPMAGVKDFKQLVAKNNLKKMGDETIQGFKCEIYEGNLKLAEDQKPAHTRIWYAEKLDYPVKTEIMLAAPMGNMSINIENIQVGSQPGSLFKIPSGYTKVGSLEEAMGMGSAQMPSMEGTAPGQPSQEQMDDMMKNVQDMMKNMQKQ